MNIYSANPVVRTTRRGQKPDPNQTNIFDLIKAEPLAEGAQLLAPREHGMRPYQEDALNYVRKRGNSIVVMKTNSGKTEVEFTLAAEKLAKGKVILVADTVLLSQQHYSNALCRFGPTIGHEGIALITGDSRDRAKDPDGLYTRARLLIGTPESFVSDLSKGILNMDGVSLVIFDEVQHMQNNDSYCVLASAAIRAGVQRLGFSASPAGSVVKLRLLVENLGTENLFHVPDVVVEKYVPSGQKQNIWVTLEPERRTLVTKLHCTTQELIYDILHNAEYYEMGELAKIYGPLVKDFRMPYMSELKKAREALNILRQNISRNYSDESKAIYKNISYNTALYHLVNMCTLAERVGSRELESYFRQHIEKGKSHATEFLYDDEYVQKALRISKSLKDHPKLDVVYEILNTEEGSALIFTETREHAHSLSSEIEKWGLTTGVLLGKKEMPIKKQLEVRKRFEEGKFRVLVATSVANEGVHLPNIRTLINYCVPYSVVDHTQRPGRVRDEGGKSYTLASAGTSEAHILLVLKAREKSLENAFAMMR